MDPSTVSMSTVGAVAQPGLPLRMILRQADAVIYLSKPQPNSHQKPIHSRMPCVR